MVWRYYLDCSWINCHLSQHYISIVDTDIATPNMQVYVRPTSAYSNVEYTQIMFHEASFLIGHHLN
jgi:hypothetical protein